MSTLAEFDTAYRRCWQTPEPLSPSQWAQRYRVLSRRQSSRPGRWSTEAAPPLSGIMDLALHPRVRKLSICKGAQVGVSEAIRNVVGYLADREPDPVLLNLPNEQHGRGIFADRILPLFEDTPRLRELMTKDGRDATLSQVSLCNGFVLRLAWSGSAASLAAHPIRVVLNDEIDKFTPWTGNESDPISLAEVRTATYPNSTIISTSTPTTRDGLIFRLWEASPIKLEFRCRCPRCRQLQALTFDRLKWEAPEAGNQHERAAALLASQQAWYECSHCGAKLVESDRPSMLMHGCWSTPDGTYQLHVDGREIGELPPEAEVGLHLSALHSLAPKHRFANIAAEFIRTKDDPMRLQNFRNSWLGEVFEIQTAAARSDVISVKSASAPDPHVVPSWAVALIATADTQKDHFWFTIRAWGHNFKSQLIHYGIATTFDELYRVCLKSSFPIDGKTGEAATPSHLLIDTGGNRTGEVYQFAMQDIGRIIPCKGASQKMQRPWQLSPQPNGITLRLIDTDYFKDALFRLMNDETDGERWQVHNAVTDDYRHQLVSEHKVFDRRKHREVWIPRTSGAANHLFDCEVLQCAAADMGNFGMSQQQLAASQPPPERDTRPRENWATAFRGRY